MSKQNRIVLWKKQRQFLDACLETDKTVTQIMVQHQITAKMLLLWYTKPAFRQRYKKVKLFLRERCDLDLRIGATHGANLLAEQQLKKQNKAGKPSLELVRIVRPARNTSRQEPKQRPAPKRLAHPENSEEENARLLNILKRR